jgi:hypothetical protein
LGRLTIVGGHVCPVLEAEHQAELAEFSIVAEDEHGTV